MKARRLLRALLAALALVLAACGGGSPSAQSVEATPPDGAQEPIRIGTKNFTEQYILGELYGQALEARGFPVEIKSDIGSSEIVHQALVGGGIDMYPEYVGVLLSEVAGIRERPRSDRAAYEQAAAWERERGFALLEMTPLSNANALAVRPETAERLGIRTIADLEKLRGGAVIGAPPEFRTRYEGLIGLRDLYDLRSVRVRRLPIGEQYAALDSGRVDAAAVFTADGQLADAGYRILRDPERLFAAQHVAPILDEEVLEEHGPGLAEAIDAVSRRLTTEAMREMNAAVALDGQTPEAVARRFLREEGLV